MRLCLLSIIVFLGFVLTPEMVLASDSEQLIKQRVLFQQAKQALKANRSSQFNKLESQLGDYPLRPYLRYLYLRQNINSLPSKTIAKFIEEQEGTFYSLRLRNAWLSHLASGKRWQAYLTYYREPQSTTHQCYRLQALIATNKTEQALKEIPPLWLAARSQPKACDPAFKFLNAHDGLTDDLLWQRTKLALGANQYSLAHYLAKQMSNADESTAWVALWKNVHINPQKYLNKLPASHPSKSKVSLSHDEPISREIIIHGINRLTQKSTEKAYMSWQRIVPAYQFSHQKNLATQQKIARTAALRHDPRTLEFFANTSSDPWKVRAALWEKNWSVAIDAINALDSVEKQTPRWQYWLARTEEKLGHSQTANSIFQTLASERDYYAFLAADKLQLPYQMNHRPIQIDKDEFDKFQQRTDIKMLREFYVLNMDLESRRQAYRLKKTLSTRELQLLATYTHQWGWHNQSIALLGQAQYWDALDIRFPIVYKQPIFQAGKQLDMDPSWLLGIARQESGFNANARSHVGAIGLMQLMPSTGKLMGKLLKRPLRKTNDLLLPDKNIQFGSAYLRRMYDKNQHNPVLATASYNAGPHRIKRWLPEQAMDADIWIENIPYNETRRYTRSVLTYAAIFDHQLDKPITLLNQRMPDIKPPP